MREPSVDILRGIAIIGMVLSGTISRNADLPAWLFHAQIPPPDFTFNPQLPGLTWVDLVFPFFIFAMGAAIPFSLGKLIEKGARFDEIFRKIVLRTVRLFVFAIALGQLSPWHYPGLDGHYPWLAAMMAFAAFFLAFGKWPHFQKHPKLTEAAGYVILAGLLFVRHNLLDMPFSFNKNDIIILVLANLALFGALIWMFTRNNVLPRLTVLALVFALRLSHGIEGSVNHAIWQFSPAKTLALWFPGLNELLKPIGDLNKTVFYNPEFLKYLLILVPGTIAGDLLRQPKAKSSVGRNAAWLFTVLILGNLWALQTRQTNWMWAINLLIGLALMFRSFVFGRLNGSNLHIAIWSYAWLLLGTVLEAWEGGIKKDPTTYSYLFLSAGLSGFTLLIIRRLIEKPIWASRIMIVEKTGMNPMLGYVAVAYLLAPLLHFLFVLDWMDAWHLRHSWLGVVRALVLTFLMMQVTQWFTNKKMFWKT